MDCGLRENYHSAITHRRVQAWFALGVLDRGLGPHEFLAGVTALHRVDRHSAGVADTICLEMAANAGICQNFR